MVILYGVRRVGKTELIKHIISEVVEKTMVLNGEDHKWNENKKSNIPALWKKAYPESTFEVINKHNYLDFIKP